MQTTDSNSRIVALIAGLVTLTATHVAPAEPTQQAWRCWSEGHARDIELNQRDAATREGELACWVVYTRDGESEVLWQARNEPDYCEPRVQALIERLQAAGFECTRAEADSRSSPQKELPVLPVPTEAAPADTTGMDPDLQSTAPSAQDSTSLDPVVTGPAAPGESDPDLRVLLERHYEDSYLDAMLAAMPDGFVVQPGMDAISPGPLEYLHVGPPDHFIKTLSDGSYVLVNTLLFERGTTSSYISFGYQVSDNRYRFLGYASTQPVAEFQVLDAGTANVVLSVTPIATTTCSPNRRTQVINWHGELLRQDPAPVDSADCREPAP